MLERTDRREEFRPAELQREVGAAVGIITVTGTRLGVVPSGHVLFARAERRNPFQAQTRNVDLRDVEAFAPDDRSREHPAFRRQGVLRC